GRDRPRNPRGSATARRRIPRSRLPRAAAGPTGAAVLAPRSSRLLLFSLLRCFALHLGQRALQRLHQVRSRFRRLARLRALDRLALALAIDDRLQPVAVAVLVALGLPLVGEFLD